MSEEEKPVQTAPKTWAAGIPAVTSSMGHILREAGLFRGGSGLMDMNQAGGFDCPSCAWPDPDGHRSLAEFCENGAKALASEATKKLADEEFFAKHTIADLDARTDLWRERQGRIARPMILRPGSENYVPIPWDEAFSIIAAHLRKLDSPDEALFYTSGRASNEAAFLYQLFARSYGTNNLPDCSNMCHESSGLALKQSIGVGKGTVTLGDFLEADVILCVGQNPGTNHPRMLTTLEEAVKRGVEIVAINPLRETGLVAFAHPQHVSAAFGRSTPLASKFIPVRVNGDLALFRGVAKFLLEQESAGPGTIDGAFIRDHAEDFESYRSLVLTTAWEEIERMSGISQEEIRSLGALLVKRSRKIITCWAMGLTQHRNAVATIREITNVHLLLGAIGRPGAGLCPVRGHSNVQGDRTVGIFEKMPESFLAALDRECGIVSPRKHGFDTVAAIHAMKEGRAKVFFALGGNFLQASPDTEYTAAALRNCELTCQVSTKLNRSHLVTGKTAIILPCLGRSERDGAHRFVSCENSMGVVQMSQGVLDPASPHLLSEVDIVARLGAAYFGETESAVPWKWLAEDYDRIRDVIERVISGFESYNERVTVPGGFYLPNPAKERRWDTPGKKAVFGIARMEMFEPEQGRLVLQTIRSHDQFNTTVYGPDDRYRGISNARRIILVNPEDLAARGIKPGTKVDITSFWKGETRTIESFVALPYEMPRSSAAAYFPEANPLVPIGSQAEGSGTPTSKSIEIEIRVSAQSDRGPM